MPEGTPYRILDRFDEDRWTPFAVAYRRGGRFVLFAPPWRAHRDLSIGSLEELSSEHFPSSQGGYRWAPGVETCEREVTHPLELLEHAAGVRAAEERPAWPPAAESIMEAIRRMLPAAPRLATARGVPVLGAPTAEAPVSAESAAADLLHVLAADPRLVEALVHLRASLDDPEMRPHVLAALEAFARAAKRQE